MIYSFAAVRLVMSTLVKTDKFNHFGRSDAWNSTHHGRYGYVFPRLRSAASLSISSVSLCLSPCVVCVGVRGLRRVFVSRCVWSKRNESECLDMCTCNR